MFEFITDNLLFVIFIILVIKYTFFQKKVTVYRVVIYMFFLFYMYHVLRVTGIVNILLNYKMLDISSDSLSYSLNNSQFIPFLFFKEGMNLYENDFMKLLFSSYFRTSLYNFLMLIPLGLFIPWLYKYNFKKTFTYGFMMVFIIEAMQFVSNIASLSTRSFNIDDFILNLCGVAFGYLLYHAILKNILPNKLTK